MDRATRGSSQEVSVYLGLPPLIVNWDFPTFQDQVAFVIQAMAEKGYELQSQEPFLWIGRKLDFRREPE